MKVYLLILSLFICGISSAQNTFKGVVRDNNQKPIEGANIKVVGEELGTVSDVDGNFTLETAKPYPFTIEISNVGFGTRRLEVKKDLQKIGVTLIDQETLLGEIVVSASRTAERIKESPVTIERMSIKDIKKTASPNFYDGLENLKEVQMNTSSLSFKSINTRGFATVANTRFMQLVDGMDNSSPLLNFVLGNLLGVSEIDVQNIELLPGASSALYGANAFNGILFMNSKSPFTSEGVTAYAKYGQTNQKAAGSNDFYDYGIRVAHAFSKHFAAKANFTFMKGTDWYATDYQDLKNPGADRSFYNYNGVNVYGDEVKTNIKEVGKSLAGLGLIPASAVNLLPNYDVSRTGYNETDLTDNKVSNSKVDMSFHYKPFADDFEIIWQSKFGFGNTVYQGANRYYLNNFFMQQHKLEFKGKNFFVRGYTTTEDGGNSYDMVFTGINVNRSWKDDKTWFGQYAGAYIQSTLAGQTPEQSHIIARNTADTGRLIPGTDAFRAAFNKVIADPDVLTGSKLVDNSRIYHSDVNYNFKDIIKFAEIQVGGSFRQYELNSHGRIYTDADGPIIYDDYGAYTQLQKKFLDERLKFTGSVRYDKSTNFDGSFSPRLSLVYAAGTNKEHNFRGSFQTGFRNPTTQDQYIGFNIGSSVLIGSAPENLARYSESVSVSQNGQAYTGGATSVTMTGVNAYQNSYTKDSAVEFRAAVSAASPSTFAQYESAIVAASPLLRKSDAPFVKPETVKAVELGYRGAMDDFSIDINGYYNIYNDFLGNLSVIVPLYGTASESVSFASPGPAFESGYALANSDIREYQLYTNTDVEIESLGFGVGLSRKIIGDFELGANYNYAQFNFDQDKDPSFEAGFNTPKHRVKVSLGNEKLFKNFGFNVSGRWSDEYLWQSTFADGMIDAATVVDAQINYSIPYLKSTIKVGGANIGGKEYQQVLGAGSIGQQYFVSFTINP